METQLQNIYLARAIQAYPWEFEIAYEAVLYALSQEPENPKALCLMGQMQAHQFENFDLAKDYFERALAADISATYVYPEFIHLLINTAAFEEALKLVKFARNLKGIDRARMELLNAQLFEAEERFEEAEELLKRAKQLSLNSEFIAFIDNELLRVVAKKHAKKHEERLKPKEPEPALSNKGSSWLRNRLNSLL